MLLKSPVALLAALSAAFLFVSTAVAHPPDEAGGEHAAHYPVTFSLPEIEGDARPWSDKPVLGDADRFQFAVMTDRTGGHRPGVWMQGVRNLNLLRPEFVVSVGDLIEGYTEDVDQIEREWSEFLGFIDQLDMRFFFVAGNHDVTNPTMHRIWREHFGREWYSFDYHGVHFLCLLSEDPVERIGDEQLAWLEQDLAKNQDARWTFVFLHKPLWTYSERAQAAGNTDDTNWAPVQSALAARPHTVFAGHVHHYVQYHRGGHEYYQLATTGGGSQLRGVPYGEFDHVTWVTMESDGPRIAHVLLDGVLAPDVVTEESIARFRKFLAEARFHVDPILLEPSADFRSAELRVTILNEFDDEIAVKAPPAGLPMAGLTLDPPVFVATLPPHDSVEAKFRVEFARPIDMELFRNVAINVRRRTTTEPAPLIVEQSLPVLIDHRHRYPRLAVKVDGNLDEWAGEVESFSDAPTTYGASGQWQGRGDGSVSFRVAHDGEFLYFGGVVTDDAVVAGRDRLLFGIDPRPASDRNAEPQLGDHSVVVRLNPAPDRQSATVRARRGRRQSAVDLPDAQVAIVPGDQGYTFEIAVPASILSDAQDTDGNSFQLNLVMLDVDEQGDEDVFILWRPASDWRQSNSNYAHFYAEE